MRLFYTTSEVADLLRVSQRTAQRLCRDGHIPHEINAAGHVVVTAEIYERIAQGLPLRTAV